MIHITFDPDHQVKNRGQENQIDLLALDEALNRLSVVDTIQASIVELRYFTWLSTEEIADQHEVSVSTVKRIWQIARAWLYRELHPDQ